jgi:thiol-disulfide isomerase/thioredoxin
MQFGFLNRSGRGLAMLGVVLLLAACSGGGNATDGESGQAVAAEMSKPTVEPIRVSQGQQIDLADYAVKGEFTVFDFMSDYCPPCQRIAPWMDRLHNEREGVSVVKVDINRPGVRGIDWKSPVAAQFRLSSIPHFKVMDTEGNLVAEGDEAWQMLVAWLEELPTPGAAGQS